MDDSEADVEAKIQMVNESNEIFKIIRNGNKETIQQYINSNAININNVIGENSYLHCAISCRNTEIVRLLLDNGAIITAEIIPPFIEPNKKILELLLTYNVDLDTRDFRGSTYLHLAVKEKFISIIDILINKGADVNAKTFTEQTVLQLAFQEKNEEIINHILQCNIDVCARDQKQETPLHYAVNFQNIKFVKFILKKKADVNSANKSGLTPLHLAVLKNNIELVEILLTSGADINSATLEKRVPLHLAVANESIEMTKLLLKNGAGVNDCTEFGITSLHTAVDTGNKEIVMLLVNNNADINAIGRRDETPLNIAVAYEHEHIAEYLISNGALVDHGFKEDTVLHMAVFNKNVNLVELLLKHNADITVKYKNDRTALHLAVDLKCSEIAEMLLMKGADINEQTVPGDTVLHISVENEDYETSEILLRYKPKINLKNKLGKTPLYIAAEKGFVKMVTEILKLKPDIHENKLALYFTVTGKEIQHKEIVLELLAHGYSMDLIKIWDYTEVSEFMIRSVSNGHSGIVEYLLRFGFDPNELPPITTNERKTLGTLLHLAAYNNQLQIAKLLIDFGSEINATDACGHTPIFYAVQKNNSEIAKLLLDNKAVTGTDHKLFFMVIRKGSHSLIQEFLKHYKNVNEEDEFGITALHFAAWNGDEETIQLLFDKGAKCKTVESLLQIRFSSRMESSIRNYYGGDALEDFLKNVITTPLHIAARKNHSDIVETLLEHELSVDCKDGCGRTPLHIAALFNNVGVIDVLVEFGADLYATDESGYTCIDYVYNSEQFISSVFLDKVFIFIHNVYDFEFQTTDCREAENLLVKYLARLNTINGITNEQFIKCYRRLENSYIDCIGEIEVLKQKIIVNNVSLYDVLTKSTSTLAVYLKNENFLPICEIEIERNEFCIYSNILKKRIRRAKERRMLLNEADIYFTSILCLPDLLTSKIMGYLYNRNLRCIKQAYELFFNELGFLKCKES